MHGVLPLMWQESVFSCSQFRHEIAMIRLFCQTNMHDFRHVAVKGFTLTLLWIFKLLKVHWYAASWFIPHAVLEITEAIKIVSEQKTVIWWYLIRIYVSSWLFFKSSDLQEWAKHCAMVRYNCIPVSFKCWTNNIYAHL